MMEAITGDNASSQAGDRGFEEDDDNDSTSDTRSIETFEEAPNARNNIRIKSKKFMREYDVGKLLEDADGLLPGMPTIEEELDGVGGLTAVTTSGVGNLGGGATSAVVGLIANVNAVAGQEDYQVPSRMTVKKISMRRSLEAKRKEEMEVRQKRCVIVSIFVDVILPAMSPNEPSNTR